MIATVVGSWKGHDTSKAGRPDKDFKKWNKMSVANRATTAHVSILSNF